MDELQKFFTTYEGTINGIVGILAILGFVGNIINFVINQCVQRRAKKMSEKVAKIENNISNLEIQNAQIENVINNYGLSYEDTKNVAKDVVNKRVERKPDVYVQKDEPQNAETGSIWLQPYGEDEDNKRHWKGKQA